MYILCFFVLYIQGYKDYNYEGFLPKPEQVVPILKQQSTLLKHVENENEYLKVNHY